MKKVEYVCQIKPKGVSYRAKWQDNRVLTNEYSAKVQIRSLKEIYGKIWKLRIIKRTITEEVVE